MEKVRLCTERLLLEAPQRSDVDAITAACQDAELQRWVPVPVPSARADAEGYVATYSDTGWESGQCCTWAIKVDGHFAGAISLISIAERQATIGYWMASEFRGRGLLIEAAQSVIDFGFADSPGGLSLQRIEWHAYAGNVASARVAQRLGFRFEGVLRLGAMGRTAREDDWVAGILVGDTKDVTAWPILALR